MTKRVAILISGGGSNMVALVEAMQQGRVQAKPVVVLSNDPMAGGLSRARDLGVPTHVVDHRSFGNRTDFEAALHNGLLQFAPDVLCLAGFMRILQPEFIQRYAGRMLNIHPSLLPKYKGLHTHQRALDAGDAYAGCSVHLVTPELDAGPVLAQSRVPVKPDDTSKTLAARVLKEEHTLYPETLQEFLSNL